MTRFAGAAVMILLLTTSARAERDKSPARGTMIDALKKMVDFVSSGEQRAMSTAQRFGMHLHDEGSSDNITFTTRDRRFSSGSASRQWKSETLTGLSVTIAPDASFTIGEARAAFGRFERSDGEHFDNPPRWVADIERDDKPLSCTIIIDLAVGFVEGDPADSLKIKKVTLVPGPKLKATSSPSPGGR